MADARHRLNLSAAGASIATALALIAIKLWAQLQTGAVSVLASLADSAVDLLMAIGALWAIRYAARPPDEDHRFGHNSAEDIAALAQSAVVVAIAGLVFAGGALRLLRPEPLRAEGAGLVAMGLSLAITLALVAFQARVARRTGSKVVLADRAHYLADVAPTVGAIVALAASLVGDAPWLDPLLAMLAALWIARLGLRTAAPALHGLMDREAAPDLAQRIDALAAETPGVRGWHDLKTRASGGRLFVQLHVEIDGDRPLAEAHRIGEALRRRIQTLGEDVEVMIHHDPV